MSPESNESPSSMSLSSPPASLLRELVLPPSPFLSWPPLLSSLRSLPLCQDGSNHLPSLPASLCPSKSRVASSSSSSSTGSCPLPSSPLRCHSSLLLLLFLSSQPGTVQSQRERCSSHGGRGRAAWVDSFDESYEDGRSGEEEDRKFNLDVALFFSLGKLIRTRSF